jgi:hypothetical protein
MIKHNRSVFPIFMAHRLAAFPGKLHEKTWQMLLAIDVSGDVNVQ